EGGEGRAVRPRRGPVREDQPGRGEPGEGEGAAGPLQRLRQRSGPAQEPAEAEGLPVAEGLGRAGLSGAALSVWPGLSAAKARRSTGPGRSGVPRPSRPCEPYTAETAVAHRDLASPFTPARAFAALRPGHTG